MESNPLNRTPIGATPAPGSLAEFVFKEYIADGTKNAVTVREKVLEFNVSRDLMKRKLYCYLYATSGLAMAFVNFFNFDSMVASLPVFATTGNTLAECLVTPFCTGGVLSSDCLILQPSGLLSGESSQTTAQALYLTGQIDKIQVNISRLVNVGSFRLVFAINSTHA